MRVIDADALKSEYQRLRMIYHADPFALTETEVASLDAISLIDKAPTLDYAPVVHGEWEVLVDKEPDIYGWVPLDTVVCSVCNKSHSTKTQYCPNCGAKMDGGKKDG